MRARVVGLAHALGLALVPMLAAGCALHRVAPLAGPAAPIEAGSAEDAEASQPTAPVGPFTLEDAIALGFENNPDLLAASARIAEAEARVGEASAALYPHVSARLSYARTTNPLEAFGMIVAQRRFSSALDVNHPGPTQNVRPEIVGTIPLFRGGQDYARRAAAALGVEAAGFERGALRNALADGVSAAYCALGAAPEQVAVTRASIDAIGSALAQARARVEAGTALRSDTLSLEVRLAAAREAKLRAENAGETARTALRVLLGLPVETPLEIVALPDATTAEPPGTFTVALERALTHRPEIEAAARVVAIREHQVRSERAAYLPRIDGVARYGQDAPDLELSDRQDNWTVGATAEIDLFAGFQTAARVRAAERRLDEARHVEHRTRLEIERDVKTAFLALAEARERAAVTQAAIAAADEALRLVEEQYRAGAAAVTRYLEAETARTEARSRAIAARYELRRAEAGLARAIGTWTE